MIDNVKNWSYPFAGASGNPLANLTGLAKARGGFYPMGANGLWHGGVHFDQGTAGAFDQSSVRCIADGEVIAYRIDDEYPISEYTGEVPLIKRAPFSTGFVLVRHWLALPPQNTATPPAPTGSATASSPAPALTFYSLYMHLQDWAGYQAQTTLLRPDFWGEGIYCVETQGSDLNVRAEPSQSAAILAALPKGTRLKIGSGNGDFRKLLTIVSGTVVPALAPTDDEGTLPGYLAFKFLKEQSEPKAKDSVVVLDSPVPIKAGDLIGHLGRYQNHNEGTSQPLLHLEVFSCEDVPAFIARSRAHAARLPEALKTLLKIHKGASKLIPHCEGINATNPPKIADEGVTVGVDLILPQSLLDSMPAANKLKVSETIPGSTIPKVTQWWRLDNLLANEAGNPICGWLAEQDMITTRHSPWEWEGYDFIEDGERPAGALAYHLEALHRLIDSERASYQGMIDLSDKGPVKQRLYAILDGNGDQKITAEEIRTALGKPWQAQSISQLITKHENEWFWDPAKWDELDELMEHSPTDPNRDWAEEKKRIEKLSWWKELGGKHGIDASGVIWHIQSLGLLVGFVKSIRINITIDMLKKVFEGLLNTESKDTLLNEIATQISENAQRYKLDTPLRLSHFFAQVRQEIGSNCSISEDFTYSANGLKGTFRYFRLHPDEAERYGYSSARYVSPENQAEIANRAYGSRNGNDDIASGDGWKYRGRGLKHLTGKSNYRAFSTFHEEFWSEPVDFVEHPELLQDNFKYTVRSGVYFWLEHNLANEADKGASGDEVDAITRIINQATDSYEKRRNNFTRVYNNEKVFETL